MAGIGNIIISKVIHDGDLSALIEQGITPSEHLSGDNAEVLQWVYDYTERHGAVPSERAFKSEYGDYAMAEPEDTTEPWSALIEELRHAWLHGELVAAVADIMGELEADKPREALDKLRATIESAGASSAQGVASTAYYPSSYDYSAPLVNDLVSGMVGLGEAGMLFGREGTGKSFLATDLAMSVATGTSFFGHNVEAAGPVFYCSAEGGPSEFQKRYLAWVDEHGDLDGLDRLRVDTAPYYLTKPGETERAIAQLRKMETDLGEPVRLVIFDTLAQCTPGEDENSQAVVGAFLGQMKRITRETGCCAVVIHHENKMGDARGGGGLRADSDFVYRVTKPSDAGEPHKLINEKNRGRADSERLAFDLPVHPFVTPGGEPADSCVVAPRTDWAESLEERLDSKLREAVKIYEECVADLGKVPTVDQFHKAGSNKAEWSRATAGRFLKTIKSMPELDLDALQSRGSDFVEVDS